MLVAWILGGVMTTAGALAYGELGAMFPGPEDHVFLKEAFGPLSPFLYGLAYALVTTQEPSQCSPSASASISA